MTTSPVDIKVENLSKSFALHNQGGVGIPVIDSAGFSVFPGECVALTGGSGVGKSTLMRMVYGNYLVESGHIFIGDVDMAKATPREILALRRSVLGHVSQFLRVVPRVPCREVVAEPLLAIGAGREAALEKAHGLLRRLNIPEKLWALSPTTFSGGERQRVNIARGFAHSYPVLLLDEPTASLDARNRSIVLDLILEAKARNAAIMGIFHDAETRRVAADREIDVSAFAPGNA